MTSAAILVFPVALVAGIALLALAFSLSVQTYKYAGMSLTVIGTVCLVYLLLNAVNAPKFCLCFQSEQRVQRILEGLYGSELIGQREQNERF